MKRIYLLVFIAIIGINTIPTANAGKLPIIAHWSFDNDSGTKLIDSGPNQLDAQLNSKDKTIQVTTVKGMKGKALVLSAIQKIQYIVKDKKGLLNLKPPFTICCWVKRTGTKPNSMSVFCKKTDTNPSGYDLRIDWYMVNLRIGNGKKLISASSPGRSIKNNIWYHIAVTNDGKKIITFINGRAVKKKTGPKDVSSITPVSNGYSAVIGNYVGRSDAYNFIGLIDELYLISKVLTEDELFQLADPGDK